MKNIITLFIRESQIYILRAFFSFLLVGLFQIIAFGQHTFKGNISDGDDPLIGATIVVKDTKVGTNSDFDGNFELEYSKEAATLIISYIGYKSDTILVSAKKPIDILLLEGSIELVDVTIGPPIHTNHRNHPILNIFLGNVSDEDGNPLVGVTISGKDKEVRTVTDLEGNFDFKYYKKEVPLQFVYTGYESVTKIVKADEPITVILQEDKLDLTDVMITDGVVIEVYATPIEHTIPAPIFKATQRMIQSNNGVNPAPVLNQVPGVIMHSGAYNTNRITIRGIGNRSQFGTAKIRAYLDDIPLTNGVGETTIEDIDMSLLGSMRIWKGPAAVTNGVGLGGLIELNTINYDNRRNRYLSNSVSSSIQFGSYGLIRNVNQFVFKKKDWLVAANAAFTKSDGYRENNEYDRKSYTLLAKHNSNNKNTTTLFANVTSLKAFIPSSLNRDDFDNNPSAAAANWLSVRGFEDYDRFMIGVSHKQNIRSKNNATDNGWNIDNTTSVFATNFDSYESRPFNILQEQTVSFGGRTKFDFGRGGSPSYPKHKYTIGAEFFQDNYDWTTSVTNGGELGALLSDNEEKRNYYNLFAKYELNLDRLNFTAGVNLNNTNYELTDLFNPDSTSTSGDYSFASILSPQVGVLYNLNNRHVIYATISHGFSPPSLEETLTPDGQINNDIQPERGWNFEIGSRRNTFERFSYDIALFKMQINDLLVAERIAEDQFVGINAGKTTHTGLELFLNYKWIDNGNHDLFSDLTYTFSDFKFEEFIDGDDDFSGNKLTGTPDHTVNFVLHYLFQESLFANLNYRFVDQMPLRDDNSIFSEAYNVVNFKVGYKKRIGQFHFNINGGINNLFDEKYASMFLINAGSFGGNAPRYFYPGLPTHFYGGIELRYRF